MKIGELAKSSGVNSKLIRHYEAIGLLPKPNRTVSGYRMYSQNDIQFLRFIKRGRRLGFPIKEIKQLMSLWRNKTRTSREVKILAKNHIKNLELKINEMQEMANNLRRLARDCHGDHRSECPILTNLES